MSESHLESPARDETLEDLQRRVLLLILPGSVLFGQILILAAEAQHWPLKVSVLGLILTLFPLAIGLPGQPSWEHRKATRQLLRLSPSAQAKGPLWAKQLSLAVASLQLTCTCATGVGRITTAVFSMLCNTLTSPLTTRMSYGRIVLSGLSCLLHGRGDCCGIRSTHSGTHSATRKHVIWRFRLWAAAKPGEGGV